MKKIIYITLFLIVAGGCKTSLKENWNDFKAYYNTHYNTKKFFSEGVEKNREQVSEINPRYPIRIHETPGRAGTQEFEKAIEGGAEILREHEESSFVEPALAIIGKSYYYLNEYFSALEKFQELNSIADGIYEQEAILWEGLVLLQMESYNEGISFLESELSAGREWEKGLLAETKSVLAEHYMERGEWETAAMNLAESVDDLKDSRTKARAFFLYGQLLEELEEFDQALTAFSKVPSLHPPYTLIFNSNRKIARIYRKMKEYETALSIFQEMARDDKNIDRRPELNYEIARTYQLSCDEERAIELYKRILRNELNPPDAVIKAQTYYGLGEIYRFQKTDFSLAAAYYDSAAVQRADPYRLPEDFDARDLAASFGDYVKTKEQISRIDSLLTLSKMEPAKLDSVLNDLQKKLEKEREEELKRMRDQRDVLTLVDSEMTETTTADPDAIRNNGFLNIRNQRLLTDASIQFRMVWGDRPLVDDWRRQEAVSGSRQAAQQDDPLSKERLEEGGAEAVLGRYTLDVSDIPVTKAQQDSMKTELQEKYYRLGNVFFLSLNMPDSASFYFKKVAKNEHNQKIKPGALYSLAEIELEAGRLEKASEYARELSEKYPETEFARRIQSRLESDISGADAGNNKNAGILEGLDNNFDDSASRANYLQLYAMNEASDDQVPLILYEAAREYMKAARSQESTRNKIDRWYLDKNLWDAKKRRLDALKDSARSAMTDTTLSEKEINYWQSIADSTLQQPDFSEIYPFRGGYWDSTRSVLNYLDTNYASSKVKPRVDRLKESMKPPDPTKPDTLATGETDTSETDNKNLSDEKLISDCSDLNITPEIEGGMDAFLSKVIYPQWTDGVVMRGDIEFELIIRESGEVVSYEQVSRMSRTGIPQAFEQAIETDLRFEPFSLDEAELMRCTLTFPINLE